MGKKEIIAMVGEDRIGGWWTRERITFVIALVVLITSGYARYVLNFLPALTELGMFVGFIFALVDGMVSLANGRKVQTTRLKVEKIREGDIIEVLGNDKKTYALRVNRVRFYKQNPEDSFAEVSYRVNNIRTQLTATKNMNEIWE